MMKTEKLDSQLLDEIKASYERIKDFVHKTPVLRSRLIDEFSACELYFKCENFQKMGAPHPCMLAMLKIKFVGNCIHWIIQRTSFP